MGPELNDLEKHTHDFWLTLWVRLQDSPSGSVWVNFFPVPSQSAPAPPSLHSADAMSSPWSQGPRCGASRARPESTADAEPPPVHAPGDPHPGARVPGGRGRACTTPTAQMGRATGRISITSVSLEARFFQEPCKEIPKLPSFKSLTLELEK